MMEPNLHPFVDNGTIGTNLQPFDNSTLEINLKPFVEKQAIPSTLGTSFKPFVSTCTLTVPFTLDLTYNGNFSKNKDPHIYKAF